MKKVLSVAMASAMVLSMGANAFAISYSTGSNEKADWPKGFEFAGDLFVTDKNGDIIEESTTSLNSSEAVDFQPGDVIWMPLYAEDQKQYDYIYTEGDESVAAASDVKATLDATVDAQNLNYTLNGSKWVCDSDANLTHPASEYFSTTGETKNTKIAKVTLGTIELPDAYTGREVVTNSVKYYNGAKRVSEKEYKELWAQGNTADVFVTVSLKGEDGTDDAATKPIDNGTVVDYGHYTGNIDKNWSINLIEDAGYAEEIVEKADLHKATVAEAESYARFGADIEANAVYVRVTLKDEWKLAKSVDMKYYVYVADNAGHKTNQVWVSGTYAPTTKTVDFQWTNDASKPAIWEAKESGTATFDFADKAFFTVKMYKGETMYLDLSTAYDKAIAGEMDAEADSFYKFDNENANFSRTGTLMIVSDDETLVPYEVDKDGNFVAVDAEYVENYAIAHTNKKVNGFMFSTKQLGNYVLSTEELGEEEEVTEEPTTEEPVVEEPTVEEPVVEETNKPNPNTGAEDFVGLAVSLAVVSVAAAGALALKK